MQDALRSIEYGDFRLDQMVKPLGDTTCGRSIRHLLQPDPPGLSSFFQMGLEHLLKSSQVFIN